MEVKRVRSYIKVFSIFEKRLLGGPVRWTEKLTAGGL